MPAEARTKSATVLLIDDSNIEVLALLDMLKERDYNLYVAFNGKQGLHRAELLRPDLILLDVNMPGMDGFTTCRMLKASPQTSKVPVIFLTASTELDSRLEGLALGAVDYITKPFYAEEVIARVQLHIELSVSLKATRAGAIKALPEEASQMPNPASCLTQAAIAILRKSLRDPPNTETVARLIGTNERKLNEAFQEVFSLSPSKWLQEERILTARHLLVTTETPVAMISEHLGFANQSNFAKAFRLRFGFTPSKARAAARTGADTGKAFL